MKKFCQCLCLMMFISLGGLSHAQDAYPDYSRGICTVNPPDTAKKVCREFAHVTKFADVKGADDAACKAAKQQAQAKLKEEMPEECKAYIRCVSDCETITQ